MPLMDGVLFPKTKQNFIIIAQDRNKDFRVFQIFLR